MFDLGLIDVDCNLVNWTVDYRCGCRELRDDWGRDDHPLHSLCWTPCPTHEGWWREWMPPLVAHGG